MKQLIFCLLCLGCSGTQVSQENMAKAEYHYRLARNYYNDRNIAMTQRELYEALRLDPNHAEAHHLKGFVLMGLADLDGAAFHLKEALRAKPDLHEARNNLGVVMLQQGRYEEAIQTLMPLIQDPLYPTPSFAHGNIGYAYYKLGDLANAKRYLEMAVFLNPRFCLGFNNLGIVYKEMGNTKSAREAFEKAIKICPKYAEPYYHLGLIQEREDIVKAKEYFVKCLELATDTTLGKRCQIRM